MKANAECVTSGKHGVCATSASKFQEQIYLIQRLENTFHLNTTNNVRLSLAATMAEEQAPTEQSHAQRLNENNTKRKRPCEAQPEDEDSTQPSPKRPLRHTECGLSMKEKNKEEAQQCLRPERDDGGQKKSRKRANRHISEQALRNMMQRALDTGSLAG